MVEAFARAVAAHRVGDWRSAERGYLDFAYDPRARQNLGALCAATGRFEESEAWFRAALEIWPDYGPSRHSLGMQLLAQGRYAEGWPYYEGRRDDPGLYMPKLDLPYPEWRGEPLDGLRLLVVGEQGYGDQIQFARFIPHLVGLGATVTFICSPAVAPLFVDLPAKVVVETPTESFDRWIFLCSIPGRLRIELGSIPAPLRLRYDASPRDAVGVVPNGRPNHPQDRYRSLSPAAAQTLLNLPGAVDLRPEATGARDFSDTARLAANLRAVLTVDTAVAHLTASVGTPAWVLLATPNTDWRWLRDGERSPWYPELRLVRQPQPGDWAGALAAAREMLSV